MSTRVTLFCVFISIVASAQKYTSGSIFAHNDYVHKIPFQTSYAALVGYIEADVFLKDGELYVAHTSNEIRKENTLEELYLKPLKYALTKRGRVYTDSSKSLTLMIDLKTEGEPTLHQIINVLQHYPELMESKGLYVAFSGNVPNPALWLTYPPYIHFDGRPEVNYSPEQLEKILLISTSFKGISSWNGKGDISEKDRKSLLTIINVVHAKHKKIRFWAIPDTEISWRLLMELGVDVINTDYVDEVLKLVKDN